MLKLASIALFLTVGMAHSEIISAKYDQPTTRYAHGVFGDTVEYGALLMRLKNGKVLRVNLPEARVFEDISPRVIDLDDDGAPEVVVIETHVNQGAQLAIYGEAGKITATPHIGRTHRWLAPIGAADLDGDGYVELAYIDRPHLAKLLKIWRYKNGKLKLVAEAGNLTNHQFGDDYISGGIRDCGNGPEMVTVNANWSDIMVSGFDGTKITAQSVGLYTGQKSIKRAMSCR